MFPHPRFRQIKAVLYHIVQILDRHISAHGDRVPMGLVHVPAGGDALIYASQEIRPHGFALEVDIHHTVPLADEGKHLVVAAVLHDGIDVIKGIILKSGGVGVRQ